MTGKQMAMASEHHVDSGERSAAFGEWRRHWPAALTASIGVATGFSMFQYNASQFIQPWQDAFGWTRGEIAIAHNGLIVTALLSPFAGTLLDRYGVRRPVLIAMVATVLAYCGMTLNNGNLPLFYLTYFLLQIAGILTTGLAFTRVVAERFQASCGLALASTRIGISIIGLVLPAVLHAVIAGYGWQSGFLLLAGLLLFVGVPTVLLGVRPVPRIAPRPKGEMGPRIAIDRGIMLLCIGAGLGYAPISAVLSQLQPMLTEQGLSASTAAMLTGLLAASVIFGVIVTGLLVDRMWAPFVACIITAAPLTGFVLLLLGTPSMASTLLAVVLIGIAQGAEIDLVAYMVRRYRGMSAYSRIYGMTILATILMGIAAQVGIAFLHDATGSYRLALTIGCAALLLSATTFLLLGAYPKAGEDLR